MRLQLLRLAPPPLRRPQCELRTFIFFFDTLNYGINEITKTKALEPNEKEISVLPQNNKKNYETSHKHPTKTSMILNKY